MFEPTLSSNRLHDTTRAHCKSTRRCRPGISRSKAPIFCVLACARCTPCKQANQVEQAKRLRPWSQTEIRAARGSAEAAACVSYHCEDAAECLASDLFRNGQEWEGSSSCRMWRHAAVMSTATFSRRLPSVTGEGARMTFEAT